MVARQNGSASPETLAKPLGTRRFALATPALCAYGTRIAEFLALGACASSHDDRYTAIEMVLRYRRHSQRKRDDKSFDRNLAHSTINVRLAAIKSLVDMARKLGKTTIDLGEIESIKSERDRDTRGSNLHQVISLHNHREIEFCFG